MLAIACRASSASIARVYGFQRQINSYATLALLFYQVSSRQILSPRYFPNKQFESAITLISRQYYKKLKRIYFDKIVFVCWNFSGWEKVIPCLLAFKWLFKILFIWTVSAFFFFFAAFIRNLMCFNVWILLKQCEHKAHFILN